MIVKRNKHFKIYFRDKYEHLSGAIFKMLSEPPQVCLHSGKDYAIHTNDNIVFKSFYNRTLLSIIKSYFNNRAKLSYMANYNLKKAGINTSEPIGFGCGYAYGLPAHEFYIAKRLNGRSLEYSLQDKEYPDWVKFNLIYTTIDLLNLLWSKDYVHRNLSICNIVIADDKAYLSNCQSVTIATPELIKKDKEMFLSNFINTPYYGEVLIELGLDEL